MHAHVSAQCADGPFRPRRQLANEALKSLNLEIARRAYLRLRDTRYIELVARIEVERRQAGHDDRAYSPTRLVKTALRAVHSVAHLLSCSPVDLTSHGRFAFCSQRY